MDIRPLTDELNARIMEQLREEPAILELKIYAQRYGTGWYPVGSDTPIPLGALVEPDLPPHIRSLFEPSEFSQEELPFHE